MDASGSLFSEGNVPGRRDIRKRIRFDSLTAEVIFNEDIFREDHLLPLAGEAPARRYILTVHEEKFIENSWGG